MNVPPMLMHIRIENKDRRFGFWLPLFLLIPIALVILIILSPLILVAWLILWCCGLGKWVKFSFSALKVAFVSFSAMRGLQVDVRGRHETVYISVV